MNGIFKEFCIRAKKDPDNNYYFIVDEINRANLSAVFGETLSLLESSYRHKVSKNSDDNAEAIGENLISTQYSALLDSLLKRMKRIKRRSTSIWYTKSEKMMKGTSIQSLVCLIMYFYRHDE